MNGGFGHCAWIAKRRSTASSGVTFASRARSIWRASVARPSAASERTSLARDVVFAFAGGAAFAGVFAVAFAGTFAFAGVRALAFAFAFAFFVLGPFKAAIATEVYLCSFGGAREK